jgi:exosortase A
MTARTLDAPAVREDSRRLLPVVPALLLGVLVLGLLFRQEIAAAVEVWTASTAYNHCFLVLPIAAYLAWDRREELVGVPVRPAPWFGLAALPLGLAWLMAERLGIMEGRQLMAMCLLQLLFLCVLGPRMYGALAAPLLYLFFLVPFGAFVTPLLQNFTVHFIMSGLDLLGIPNFTDGMLIQIPEGNFYVAEACAGLRFLIASIAFGALYSILMYRSVLKRVVFIALSTLVPVVANGFRALGIVTLGHALGSAQAAETDHVLYGWIFFSLVTLLLIALGLPFRDDTMPRAQRPRPLPGPSPLLPSLLAAAVLMALTAIAPVAAAQLDRVGSQPIAAPVPYFAANGDCAPVGPAGQQAPPAGIPGRIATQRFLCGGQPILFRVEIFSPRTGASTLLAEQRRLGGEIGVSDVSVQRLPGPTGAQGWRLVETEEPYRAAATALWVDGKPARGGLAGRIEQARNSLFGSGFPPVLAVIVVDDGATGMSLAAQRRAPTLIDMFLRSQPALEGQLARLASTGPAVSAR